MRIRSFILASGILLAACSKPDDNGWRERFLKEQRALAACQDTPCYKKFVEDYLTRGNREYFAQVSDEVFKEIMDLEAFYARIEAADEGSVETETIEKGNRADMTIKSRYDLDLKPGDGMAVRIYTKEDGVWKIGFDGEEKKGGTE